MLKGHDVWKFKIKKRVNSYGSLKSRLKRYGFVFEKGDGAYYAFSEKPSYYDFNVTVDGLIKRLVNKHFLHFLLVLGRTVVIKAKKVG